MEKPRHLHEIVRPLKELGHMVLDLIVPSSALSFSADNEHDLGHRVIIGELTAEQAYEALK